MKVIASTELLAGMNTYYTASGIESFVIMWKMLIVC